MFVKESLVVSQWSFVQFSFISIPQMLARVFLPPGGNIWNYKIIGLQSYKVAQANVQLHFAKICQDMGGLHTCQQDSNKMVQ